MALRLPISSSHGLASTTCRPGAASGSLFFPPAAALAVGSSSSAASQKRRLLLATASETRGVAPVRSSGLEARRPRWELRPSPARSRRSTRTPSGPSSRPPATRSSSSTCTPNVFICRCGPCKVMAPKFQEMSEKNLDVVFLKLDCNQDNKPLAKELGIKVVPTFKILKDGKVVKEVTGAKIEELAHVIETIKSG